MLNELNGKGTTVIVSTHDVEALPELADRVIVISHGSLLGEGSTPMVLQDSNLLKSAGLEPPAIVKLFNDLKVQGLINEIPITIKDGQEKIGELLKQKRPFKP